MRYFFSGGGSGGHLTPLIAVAEELKKRQPEAQIHAVVHRGDNLNSLISDNPAFTKVHQIFAGKLRRYHGKGLRGIGLVDLLKNIRDVFFLGLGFLQSCYLMARYRPNALLMRGGYVGVPLGFAARIFRRPYMTHDSDAIASLANRLIASGAAAHAISATPEHYPYKTEKTVLTGIPLQSSFKPVTATENSASRRVLGLPEDAVVILVTGGGLGAVRLNSGVSSVVKELLEQNKNLYVFHQSGKGNEEAVKEFYKDQGRVEVFGFRDDLGVISSASDLVITRAGATAMAEFATQRKPMILIPNPLLTGGHQLHNAFALESQNAAVTVEEDKIAEELPKVLAKLLDDPTLRDNLGLNASRRVPQAAASKVVDVLLSISKGGNEAQK